MVPQHVCMNCVINQVKIMLPAALNLGNKVCYKNLLNKHLKLFLQKAFNYTHYKPLDVDLYLDPVMSISLYKTAQMIVYDTSTQVHHQHLSTRSLITYVREFVYLHKQLCTRCRSGNKDFNCFVSKYLAETCALTVM